MDIQNRPSYSPPPSTSSAPPGAPAPGAPAPGAPQSAAWQSRDQYQPSSPSAPGTHSGSDWGNFNDPQGSGQWNLSAEQQEQWHQMMQSAYTPSGQTHQWQDNNGPSPSGGSAPTVSGGSAPTVSGGSAPTVSGGSAPTVSGGSAPTTSGGSAAFTGSTWAPDGAGPYTVNVTNSSNTTETLTAVGNDGSSNSIQLAPGQNVTVQLPANWGGNLRATTAGQDVNTATLFEIDTGNGSGGPSYYDISDILGNNVPLSAVAGDGTGAVTSQGNDPTQHYTDPNDNAAVRGTTASSFSLTIG